MMQEFIVAVVVIAAVISLLKRYLPPATRRAIASLLAAMLRAVGLAKWAEGLQTSFAAASNSAGCSGCSGCSSTAPKTQAQQQYKISLESLRRTAHK